MKSVFLKVTPLKANPMFLETLSQLFLQLQEGNDMMYDEFHMHREMLLLVYRDEPSIAVVDMEIIDSILTEGNIKNIKISLEIHHE